VAGGVGTGADTGLFTLPALLIAVLNTQT
jgi:hypothetical protein